MTSKRETALAALETALSVPGVAVARNPAGLLPERIPEGGLVVLRDGDQGDPVEVTLSPLTYHWEHLAQVEIHVRPRAAGGGDADRDAVLGMIGTTLIADRTLGGAVDWLELSGAATLPPPPGSGYPPAAVFEARLFYTTDSPLG